jgi:hypothetical protein
MVTNWKSRADDVLNKGDRPAIDTTGYKRANADLIRRILNGFGIDSGRQRPNAGMRVVFNVPAVHVSAILKDGFKNAHDLAAGRLGDPAPEGVSSRRARIDQAITAAGRFTDATKLYYGAVELNGAGMPYYGDMCLVLRPASIADETAVLFRNSYDLDRDPIRSRVGGEDCKLQDEAGELIGRWPDDVPEMAICKIVEGAPDTARLCTTAAVSGGVLCDEDYLEVVRERAFDAEDIAEVRTSATDAGAEALIAQRQVSGPIPTAAQSLWRQRRRDAERTIEATGIAVRIVTTVGRLRG